MPDPAVLMKMRPAHSMLLFGTNIDGRTYAPGNQSRANINHSTADLVFIVTVPLVTEPLQGVDNQMTSAPNLVVDRGV